MVVVLLALSVLVVFLALFVLLVLVLVGAGRAKDRMGIDEPTFRKSSADGCGPDLQMFT